MLFTCLSAFIVQTMIIVKRILEEMTFNIPQKPDSLLKLEILQKRKTLSQIDRSKLKVMQKGYQGERDFAEMVRDISPTGTLVLYDLFLEWGSSYFQIDCLIISRGEVFLLDIKNFERNYVYQNDNFHSLNKDKTIKNPLHQLKRCKVLLQDMLTHYHFHHTIHAYLIFIHPSFILYQAPTTLDIIYSGQIQGFLKMINTTFKKTTNNDKGLAVMLKEKHVIENKFAYQPVYHYDELKKGILCLHCDGILYRHSRKSLRCEKCHAKETYESAVSRMVIEYGTLFPDKKLTSRKIYQWTNGFVPRRRISNIMKKYMKVYGRKSGTYYQFHA